MKINELRIGNYISPLGRGITVVEGLCTWDGLIQSSNFAERGIEDFEPIPLTEEWYEKLGLKKITAFNGAVCWGNDKFVHSGVHPECEYVHQLQNLFFVMTGDELTIKAEE
jgi:hypothetical protein